MPLLASLQKVGAEPAAMVHWDYRTPKGAQSDAFENCHLSKIDTHMQARDTWTVASLPFLCVTGKKESMCKKFINNLKKSWSPASAAAAKILITP